MGLLSIPTSSSSSSSSSSAVPTLFLVCCAFFVSQALGARIPHPERFLPFIWPLPEKFSFGNETLSLDPALSLSGNGAAFNIVREAFERYKGILFKHGDRFSFLRTLRPAYDVNKLSITVHSNSEELQLGVDESYNLFVSGAHQLSGSGGSQLRCDTSRHYLPVNVIKQIIEAMSYAKLNVLHWHIIDEQSFPLEVPSYPNLWKGSYSEWERYTIEDAHDIVNFSKMRGINVMAEVDVPGHAASWGVGYPDLWPSPFCKQPLDVSKKFTFDILSGILTDMRKIFPFELFHLGGDEVNTGKKPSTLFHLSSVRRLLGPGVCPKAVAKGFRCVFSNQGVWYLDHLNVPWEVVYDADPLEGIQKASEKKLVIGGEVCMWGETADTSDVQQTIWPRAAAAAERLWSPRDFTSGKHAKVTALKRLQYFRCLLNRRGVAAAPVTNFYARTAPDGPGSCLVQ
ncbi:hexosaminidase [Vigna unguiculata]|uniref:beta-N-acetylhexosaminidase n=1 Tax=Vigna unguiculata TaxID=3917 RepID=A0A4D6MVY6_VIGUN|nr:hexosaminidase [Vigna unguiculata]